MTDNCELARECVRDQPVVSQLKEYGYGRGLVILCVCPCAYKAKRREYGIVGWQKEGDARASAQTDS